jgi:ABC-type branched-subunit amino acid transport system substrate-binding protein
MKRIKIGIIGGISGPTLKMGIGFRDSILFIFERMRAEMSEAGIEIDAIVKDDIGNPVRSLSVAQECYEDGCVTILGPCDSACMYEILKLKEIQDCPIITPLATATILGKISAPNFFRMTTPDERRSEMLVGYVNHLYPKQCIHVYAFIDTPHSYSQMLKQDVTRALEKLNCQWYAEDFTTTYDVKRIPKKNEPIILCSPSTEAANLVAKFREKEKLRSQIFTFGSNSNLLAKSLINTIVVADLDRLDTNIDIKNEINRFVSSTKSKGDPSLSTLNCAAMIVNLLVRRAQNVVQADGPSIRKLILDDLRSKPQSGILGMFSFTDKGEMIGPEHLSVLKVASRFRGYSFIHVSPREKPHVQSPISIKQIAKDAGWILGIIAAIIAIIGFISHLLTRCG